MFKKLLTPLVIAGSMLAMTSAAHATYATDWISGSRLKVKLTNDGPYTQRCVIRATNGAYWQFILPAYSSRTRTINDSRAYYEWLCR